MASPSSLFSVAGKNVLVTGGSRGIGLMIAKGFVNAGANVLLTSRNEEVCKEAAASLDCQYVASNVSNREGCEKLADDVAQIFQNRLHVLVNNAGTSWGEPLERKSGKANWGFDKVLDLVRTSREGINRSQCMRMRRTAFLILSCWNCHLVFLLLLLLLECQGYFLSDPGLYTNVGTVGDAGRSSKGH
jgi:hypothetical protein